MLKPDPRKISSDSLTKNPCSETLLGLPQPCMLPSLDMVKTLWGWMPVGDPSDFFGQTVTVSCVKPMQKMLSVSEGIHPPVTDNFWRQSEQASKIMKEKYARQGETIDDVVNRVVQEFELHLPDVE